MANPQEGFSKARLEAFSDGVIAVIITIMVLDLKSPESDRLEDLLRLWPGFLSYLISFTYVAVYWINHHYLLAQIERVTPSIIWANNLLLFFLSLFPFASAYMAATHLSPIPTMIYGGLQFICGGAFSLLAHNILRPSARGSARRKDLLAQALYAIAIVVAYFSPSASLVIFIVVGLLYVVPGLLRPEVDAQA